MYLPTPEFSPAKVSPKDQIWFPQNCTQSKVTEFSPAKVSPKDQICFLAAVPSIQRVYKILYNTSLLYRLVKLPSKARGRSDNFRERRLSIHERTAAIERGLSSVLDSSIRPCAQCGPAGTAVARLEQMFVFCGFV
eukprot:g6079.t1